MRKLLRRAGWAIAAASILGTGYESLAQTPMPQMPGTAQGGMPAVVVAGIEYRGSSENACACGRPGADSSPPTSMRAMPS